MIKDAKPPSGDTDRGYVNKMNQLANTLKKVRQSKNDVPSCVLFHLAVFCTASSDALPFLALF